MNEISKDNLLFCCVSCICFNDNRDNLLCVMEKPAHKKLSLLSLLSLKTTLSFRILSCVLF